MDLRHLGAVGERLDVAGYAGQVGVDDYGVSEDHGDQLGVLTDGNNLPAFVSPELRECEPTWHSRGVLVLLGKGYAAQDDKDYCNHRNHCDLSFLHGLLLSYHNKLSGICSKRRRHSARYSFLFHRKVPIEVASN